MHVSTAFVSVCHVIRGRPSCKEIASILIVGRLLRTNLEFAICVLAVCRSERVDKYEEQVIGLQT
jgi:hypothetical protein